MIYSAGKFETFNPVTCIACRAVTLKTTNKSTNLETINIKAFPPEYLKRFLSTCTVLKVDLLRDHQRYCLQACMCALFSPDILQAVAVKGLTENKSLY